MTDMSKSLNLVSKKVPNRHYALTFHDKLTEFSQERALNDKLTETVAIIVLLHF